MERKVRTVQVIQGKPMLMLAAFNPIGLGVGNGLRAERWMILPPNEFQVGEKWWIRHWSIEGETAYAEIILNGGIRPIRTSGGHVLFEYLMYPRVKGWVPSTTGWISPKTGKKELYPSEEDDTVWERYTTWD